jgi:ferrous iron transport protein B
VRRAGTVILLLSVVLWAMATYPKLPEGAAGEAVVAALMEGEEQAGVDEAGRALEYSFAGRVGKAFEPVFAPLGFDWRINVGVISSFAAREMIISTLAVVYSVEGDEDEQVRTLAGTLENARRPDGTLEFTTATALSLLVFYILAMQCIPTSVITWRETRHWKWPLLQWLFMTGLAYLAALLVYQVASRMV